MEKIPTESGTKRGEYAKKIERAALVEKDFMQKFTKSLLDVASVSVALFLMLAVILITTTDIHLTSFKDFAGFTLDFFLLLFCSYSMYLNSADSGTRAGMRTETYAEGHAAFQKRKAEVIERKLQTRLPEFCYHYIVTELYNTRNGILAVIGFSYEVYEAQWLGKADEEVEKGELTAGQKKAIIKANATEPIKLTPEMMMKRGKAGWRRGPLGVTPEAKRSANFVARFVYTIITAVLTSMIALEAVTDPTWTVIVTCVVKLITIVTNGVLGYKFGYENIVIDTVDYMADQETLLREALEYFAEENSAAEAAEGITEAAEEETTAEDKETEQSGEPAEIAAAA